jgi:hypothetical protein
MRLYALSGGGLAAPLPITLRINTPYQTVGGKAVFTIVGAPPGAEVYWSSYKNGVATGELNASYGHKIEPNGTTTIESAAWTTDQTGDWIKEILVKDSSGQVYTAMVPFAVRPTPPASSVDTGSEGMLSDALSAGIELGGVTIPYWAIVLAGFVIVRGGRR